MFRAFNCLTEQHDWRLTGELRCQPRLGERQADEQRLLFAGRAGLRRHLLRAMADALRNKWKTGVVVLATVEDAKVAIIAAVTKDLTTKVHAGKLAGSVAAAVGGKGGGRPDMAEAGGSDPGALPAALDNVYAAVEGML